MVEMATSSSKMLQIRRKTDRSGKQTNPKWKKTRKMLQMHPNAAHPFELIGFCQMTSSQAVPWSSQQAGNRETFGIGWYDPMISHGDPWWSMVIRGDLGQTLRHFDSFLGFSWSLSGAGSCYIPNLRVVSEVAVGAQWCLLARRIIGACCLPCHKSCSKTYAHGIGNQWVCIMFQARCIFCIYRVGITHVRSFLRQRSRWWCSVHHWLPAAGPGSPGSNSRIFPVGRMLLPEQLVQDFSWQWKSCPKYGLHGLSHPSVSCS